MDYLHVTKPTVRLQILKDSKMNASNSHVTNETLTAKVKTPK